MDYGRLHWYEPGELDEAQQTVADAIRGGPRGAGPQAFPMDDPEGRFYGPFNAMIAEPRAGAAVEHLGAVLRYGTDLAPRAREIAILLVAASRQSEFEWYAHERVGRQVGLSEAEIAALRSGGEPAGLSPEESAVFAVASALAAGDLPDGVLAATESVLGTAAICDLVTLVGFYGLIALSLRVWRVPLPDGIDPVFG